jgi:hypothetical protein
MPMGDDPYGVPRHRRMGRIRCAALARGGGGAVATAERGTWCSALLTSYRTGLTTPFVPLAPIDARPVTARGGKCPVPSPGRAEKHGRAVGGARSARGAKIPMQLFLQLRVTHAGGREGGFSRRESPFHITDHAPTSPSLGQYHATTQCAGGKITSPPGLARRERRAFALF